jgi:5'-3' exonuclease
MILLVDGNNMAYRALFKFNLSNKGVDVSVTFGVLRMLISIINKYHPRSVIVAWDGGIPKYRRALLPQYKAHRKKDDDRDWDDIHRQMNELCDYALPMCGITTLRRREIEADDFLATASRMVNDRPYIVTMDDDLLQCVDKRTSVIKPLKGIIVDNQSFVKHVGVKPEQYLLYKTLVGDGSDNIPGIKGIGPKTAAKLLHVWRGCWDALNYLPAKTLSARQLDAILSFGEEPFWDMHDVMDLSCDRVGAHKVIMDRVSSPFNAARFKKYCMKNAFVSLMGGDTSQLFAGLNRPEYADIRHPILPLYRRSL